MASEKQIKAAKARPWREHPGYIMERAYSDLNMFYAVVGMMESGGARQ